MRSLLVLVCAAVASALSPHVLRHESPHVARSAATSSRPNVVTELLAEGKWAQAQANSKVHLDGYNTTDLYSGFFTIDKATDSQTYFMFSTAMSGVSD